MLGIKTLSIIAITGGAAASPWLNGPPGKYFSDDHDTNVDTAATVLGTVSADITVTYHDGGEASITPTAVAVPSSTPTASSGPAEEPATPSASSYVPMASSSSGGGTDYMGIVDKWRAKLGLSDLTQDGTLEGNALKTVRDGNGEMIHQLNPGSFAQVLAPGSSGEFEKVFVGGWLCERPELPGLDGICTTMSQGWAYDGQTGHADILASHTYSKIGCAQAVGDNNVGIWGCDLA